MKLIGNIIWVVFGGMDLLEALEQRQDERTVQAAEKCRQRCMASLRFAVLSCMVLNAVQLLCMHAARQVHVTLMLPLESLILLLGALLFLLNNEAASFITGVVIPVDGGFSAYSGV